MGSLQVNAAHVKCGTARRLVSFVEAHGGRPSEVCVTDRVDFSEPCRSLPKLRAFIGFEGLANTLWCFQIAPVGVGSNFFPLLCFSRQRYCRARSKKSVPALLCQAITK